MQENARLAALILDQITGKQDITIDESEFVGMLQVALQDGRSRLDLRDKLFAGARATNLITPQDIVEVMTQSLADEIRDVDERVADIENSMVPSRLALGSLVGLVLGTAGTLLYGAADPVTSTTLIGALVIATIVVSYFRKRAFRGISAMRKLRANYDSFRGLLRESK